VQPLYLRHITLATSIGIGLAATLHALRERRSGLAPCAFETADLNTFVGQVADRALIPVRENLVRFDCRNNRLAQLALLQDGFAAAAAQARRRFGPARVGVFVGTSTSGILETELAYRRRDPHTGALPVDFEYAGRHNSYALAAFVQAWLDLRGPSVVVSTACSSSVKVFAAAARAIAAGLCDAAVVGGADSLCLTTLYGFHSLGLVSSTACRPFDRDRSGISIGEGAGFALLAREGDDSDLRLLGAGESADAYHMSTPHPDGLGARLAMERALQSAQLEPGAIDYINLHGTATRTNDESEARAVRALFGAATPCSSTKGWTGHALGASGIIETAICWLALQHGFMPGSCHTLVKDPALDVNYLLDNRSVSPARIMSNSFGFGGTNCSIVLGRA
jgi:3-oxoacyl-[acyl-carrier-protein] synthase-1